MLKLLPLFILCLSLFTPLSAETNQLIAGMSLTTEPVAHMYVVQDSNFTIPYTHERLPLNGRGYYSLEGSITIDSLLENPALFIGSTIYPTVISIDEKPVYQWGNGENIRPARWCRSYREWKIADRGRTNFRRWGFDLGWRTG